MDDIFTVKKQLDDYDKYFAVNETVENGYLVSFKTPVFTEDDVHKYISQTGPSSVNQYLTAAKTEKYVYKRIAGLNSEDSLVLQLTFSNLQNEFRLADIEIPKKIARFFSKEIIVQCMKTLTTARRSGTRATIDISKIDMSYLPSPEVIKSMFVFPDSTILGNRIIYKYQYKAGQSPTAYLQIGINKGVNPSIEFVSLTYGPLEIKINLNQKTATGHLKFLWF